MSSVIERFEGKFIPEQNSGCWLWIGATAKGYGKFKVKSYKLESAHRMAWTLYRGEIPAGISVLHKCDRPKCVNPDHLFLGDKFANMRDCRDKGRTARSDGHGSTRLTTEQVLQIRADSRTQKEIAAEHGVTRECISRIKRHISWKYV